MSSWVPSFPFSFSVPWPTSSPSEDRNGDWRRSESDSLPIASTSTRQGRRFPSPPSRGADADATRVSTFPIGHKRARSSPDDENEPGRKKRKAAGIVGAVIGKALDAAVFSTAMGYSAYQLWKHPPTKDDVDALVQQKQLMLADTPHSSTSTSGSRDAPPPYSELVSSQAKHPLAAIPSPVTATPVPASPSQIPRRVRHAHERRPGLGSQSSSFPPGPLDASAFAFSTAPTFQLDSSSMPLPSPSHDPLADLPPGPIPEFHPYCAPKPHAWSHSGESQALTEDSIEEEFEEDDEMRAVSERLKNLIETGRDALASRPREWSGSSDSTLATNRSRISTDDSLSSATTVASPRKPSPLTHFTSRFDSRPSASTPARSSRQSLPGTGVHDLYSSSHARRRSLDNFSRSPDPATITRSDLSSPDVTHRHSQSHGGSSINASVEVSDERGGGGEGQGVAIEFERVLQRAKSRSSTGGR